jgi:hypothetical protein
MGNALKTAAAISLGLVAMAIFVVVQISPHLRYYQASQYHSLVGNSHTPEKSLPLQVRIVGSSIRTADGQHNADIWLFLNAARETKKPLVVALEPSAKFIPVDIVESACNKYGIDFEIIKIKENEPLGPNGKFMK